MGWERRFGVREEEEEWCDIKLVHGGAVATIDVVKMGGEEEGVWCQYKGDGEGRVVDVVGFVSRRLI